MFHRGFGVDRDLGRLLLPGKDPVGFMGTVAAGIAGALVGWLLFTYLLGIGDKD